MWTHVIDESIEVSAPPERVFEVLTRTDQWPRWTKLLVFLGGTLKVGNTVRLGLRSEATSYDFNAVITQLEPARCFEWLAKTGVPGIFDGRHRFELSARPNGRTVVRNVETYTGLLVPVIRRLAMMRTAPEGFRALNNDLRRAAEQP